MNIGGIQKTSLIDYPGKVSCVVFLSGCNFDCPYCHNPELVKGCAQCPAALQNGGLFSFLEKRRGFLDGVVISGGEPTLQENELASLCRRLKEMGYPVKLDTNGSRPKVLQRLLKEGLIDYVAMDIKTDPFCYSPTIRKQFDPSELLAAIGLIMEQAPGYEFRTTCVPSLIDERVVAAIARLIAGADLYALQHFEGSCVLHPEYFQQSPQPFDDETLQRFCQIAAPHVKRCIVR